MPQVLNLLGVLAGVVLVMTALRVLFVANRFELSPRTVLAFFSAVSGAWPVALVCSGRSNLPFGWVLLLLTVAAYILWRVYQAASVGHDPRRRTDIAELF